MAFILNFSDCMWERGEDKSNFASYPDWQSITQLWKAALLGFSITTSVFN